MNRSSTEEHWDKAHASHHPKELGWYEVEPDVSLKLIQVCNLSFDDAILDVGVGASTLLEYLLDEGYRNIRGLEISEIALFKLHSNLGEKKAAQVKLATMPCSDEITYSNERPVLKTLHNLRYNYGSLFSSQSLQY